MSNNEQDFAVVEEWKCGGCGVCLAPGRCTVHPLAMQLTSQSERVKKLVAELSAAWNAGEDVERDILQLRAKLAAANARAERAEGVAAELAITYAEQLATARKDLAEVVDVFSRAHLSHTLCSSCERAAAIVARHAQGGKAIGQDGRLIISRRE